MYAHVIARALVQNVVQFNGAHGCTFCEESGKNIRTSGGGNVHTIPFDHASPKGTCKSKYSPNVDYNNQKVP